MPVTPPGRAGVSGRIIRAISEELSDPSELSDREGPSNPPTDPGPRNFRSYRNPDGTWTVPAGAVIGWSDEELDEPIRLPGEALLAPVPEPPPPPPRPFTLQDYVRENAAVFA